MRATENKAEVFVLDNGLRCVYRQAPGAVFCGLVVNVGSRNDPADLPGMAHFVEHTIFKGTSKRNSARIANYLECVGGELNAYTSKEETVVYAAAPSGYTARAFELLADITADSVFPAEELAKEREVIIDEINMYLDNPAERVFDEFDDLIYAGSAVGHNILGTPDSVRRIDSHHCREFLTRNYTAENSVLYCVSDDGVERVKRLAARVFSRLTSGPKRKSEARPEVNECFDEERQHSGHQAHTIMGCRVPGRFDESRYALFLLNNLLGGPGMNSVLNREMRDRRGLVYTVDSNVSLMSDSGTWLVYFGCDSHDVDKCRKIVTRELQHRADKVMSEATLNRAKTQYIGQLMISGEHKESRAMSLGKSVMYFGRVMDTDEVAERIRNVSGEEVRRAAEMICNHGLSRLTYKTLD